MPVTVCAPYVYASSISTVWLAHDTETSAHVALKIVKSAAKYTEAAEDEIDLLQAINDVRKRDDLSVLDRAGADRVVELHGHFRLKVCWW